MVVRLLETVINLVVVVLGLCLEMVGGGQEPARGSPTQVGRVKGVLGEAVVAPRATHRLRAGVLHSLWAEPVQHCTVHQRLLTSSPQQLGILQGVLISLEWVVVALVVVSALVLMALMVVAGEVVPPVAVHSGAFPVVVCLVVIVSQVQIVMAMSLLSIKGN